jgi:hypothetical protein
MAIEPYQRRIGVPDSAGGGMTRIADTRSFDLGPAISSLSDTLQETFAPILADEAVKRGNEEAGKVMFTHTEDGKLMLPPRTKDGGRLYAAAFDKVIETRYLNEVGTSFQSTIDKEAADRRTGIKKYDAAEFAASVGAQTEGVLAGIDPRIRPQVEEILQREGLERTRAFTTEWSGTKRRQAIDGVTDQINFHQASITNWRALGYTGVAEATTKHGAPIEELLGSLKAIGAVDEKQADAIIMERNQRTDGIKRYVEGMEAITNILPAVNGLGFDDVSKMRYMLQGVPLTDGITGIVETEIGATEVVTDELLKGFVKADFGFEASSGARPADHPLSIAARKAGYISNHDISGPGGGRAIDIPANGKPIEFYINRFKKAGFEILEADDEYKNPSAIATAGHYHFAFGNKRKVTATHELPVLKESITFEFLNGLDGAAKQVLLGALTDREQQIRSDETKAAAQARQDASDAKTQQMIDAIISTTRDGVYNYTNTQRDTLDVSFNSEVNKVGGLNTKNGRDAAISFISNYAYMPGSMKGWFTSNLRNPNSWKSALDLYNSTKVLTTQSGSNMGDVLTDALSAKDKALFDSALKMQEGGVDDAIIGAQIKNIIDGKSYTASEAQGQVNSVKGKDAYRQAKVSAFKDLFNIDGIPPKDLSNNYDEAFAANLAIYKNDVDEAVTATRGQLQSLSVRNPIFFTGIGYKNVITKIGGSGKAFNQILMNHLQTLTRSNGTPVLQKVMIANGTLMSPIVGGPNSTIKISPLDGNINEIGRYQVYIYDPANRKKLLDRIVVDFSRDLNPQIQAYTYAQRISSQTTDKAGIAKARRQKEIDTLAAKARTTAPVSPF